MVSFAKGGGGEGAGNVVQGSKPSPPHTHTSHSSLPFFYIDFLRLGLLRLRNIQHYIVE